MLNFFNNIKKKDDDDDIHVKEHYIAKYNPTGTTGENDIIGKILYGFVIFFAVVVAAIGAYELWQKKKLIKTNHVDNGSVPAVPAVSVVPAVQTVPAVPAQSILQKTT